MNVSDLVTEFEQLGVRLWADDGRLRYRAPRGVLTEERKATLVEHKADLLAYLDADTAELVSDPAGRHEPFPLTQMQSAYQLGRHQVFDYGGVACTGYLDIAYDGAVSPDDLERAWNQLVRRHDMLRAVVHGDGHQRVLPAVDEYRIPVTDLRGASPDAVETHLDAVRRELTGTPGSTETWPLFALRTTVTDQATLLHLLVELIVVDSASVQLLLGELDALLRGHTPPPLDVTFRDYVLAERSLRAGPRFQRDRSYWLDRIDDLPPAPELPGTGREEPAPGAGPVRFRRLDRQLSATEWAGLRKRAERNGVTASAVLLTAYAETVGRWSRHRRFTLNLPVFNRLPLHERIGSVVGDFTSVNLLAVDLDAAPTFAGRVATVSGQLFDDLDHRLFSGLDVLAELTRRHGSPALMPVVFTSTIGTGAATEAPLGRFVHGVTQTPQVWLDCQVVENADGVLLAWDVRDDVFPDGLAADAFSSFADLVRRLATTDEAWDDAAPVTLPPEQRARRSEVNDTAAALPDHLLHDPVLARADTTPQRVAVIDTRTTMTYAELTARARAAARRLRGAGCRPGERVAICMVKGADQIVGVLAVLLAGAVYVPVDPGQPAARRDRILGSAGVRFALTQSWSGTADQLPAEVRSIAVDDIASPHIESAQGDQGKWGGGISRPGKARASACEEPCDDLAAGEAGNSPSPPPGSPDDPAYVIYTSGSTGEPKGVVISHRAAANTIEDINARFDIGPDDRVLSVVNLGFDLSVYDIFGVLAAGGTVVLPDPERRGDPSHWAELIDRHGVTLWNTVPSQLQMLQDYADSAAGSDRLGTLRLALLSGDWIPVALPDRVRATVPDLRVVSLGGATEAAIWSIWYPIAEVRPEWRSIPYGTPLTNQSFRVLDDALQDRPDWVPGELYIGGAGLAQGYLGDPERTSRRFITCPATGERLYRTGDLGRYLPDGTIEFLGREDTQVKIRGHRVELGEIEAVLRAHPAVADAAVLADGERESRRLTGFAELAQGDPGTDDGAGGAAAAQVIDAATAAWTAAENAIEAETFTDLMQGVDEVAVQAMAAQLRADGLFTTPGAAHTADEIAAAVRVSDRHRRLLRRWLDALVDAGALRLDDDGTYRDLAPADDAGRSAAWERVDELERRAAYGAELLRFVRTCTGRLGEMLRGEFDVRDILFPDGEFGAAHAVYRENQVGRSMNGVVAAAVRRLAELHAGRADAGPLRILEVGAGIAGTSADVVAAVADLEPDYLFTDVSEFFLSEARSTFDRYPWMRYGRFDINAGLREQGYLPNSADVVLCANVLHNSRHADDVLARLRDVLAPGGWLIFIEPTRRHNYSQLVSMEFEFTREDFDDERARTGQSFFTRHQWLQMLARAGAADAVCVPPENSALALAGQGVFLARFDDARAYTTPDAVLAHLATQLPDYMVPQSIQLVDALPRSANGKLDRSALAAWSPGPGPGAGAAPLPAGADPAADDLERRVAVLWSELLGVEVVGRDQDFYSLGGDSLLLSRMLGRLREQVPEAGGLDWAVLLRQMLHDPTVRGLVGYLSSAGDAGTEAGAKRSPVVVLAPAPDDAPTFVLVHAGTGTLQPYQPLLSRLRADRGHGLLGVEMTDLDHYLALPPEAVIDRLAAGYARDLLEHGTRFTVVGYCLGGLLATEVARALTEAGATVDGLTVISSYQPPAVEDELMVEYLFAQSMGAALDALGLPADADQIGRAVRSILQRSPGRLPPGCLTGLDGEDASVGAAFREFAGAERPERLAAIHRVATADGAYNSGSYTLDEFTRYFDVFRQSMLAVARHRPDPYAGPTTLLRNSGSSTLLPGSRADVARFWERICVGELSVHDLPGDHFSCMAAANAPTIAAALTGVRR
ncbi:non-ribosomal peptide synthetase [Phytoactinopolyspora halotolerans]|uniref:Phenyloxazoline synthase MbtB n=1 Tax=Phytoactinopolyspora halotolerans TaxID=1981512 RepID=A0A6L9SBS6_9ACTN|nr:non-ribosomal peptide synthetase [Phytoactinopolyspora halotolerans]NEE02716.1 amino acid adenylation domain-containing protein [Phytoactinopolyspora halotolerans]